MDKARNVPHKNSRKPGPSCILQFRTVKNQPQAKNPEPTSAHQASRCSSHSPWWWWHWDSPRSTSYTNNYNELLGHFLPTLGPGINWSNNNALKTSILNRCRVPYQQIFKIFIHNEFICTNFIFHPGESRAHTDFSGPNTNMPFSEEVKSQLGVLFFVDVFSG